MQFQQVLTLRAGTAARASLAAHGLAPDRVGAMTGAAGGPKWLILSAAEFAEADDPVRFVKPL